MLGKGIKIVVRDCYKGGTSIHDDESEETFLNNMLASGWICTVIRERQGCSFNNRYYYFYPISIFKPN